MKPQYIFFVAVLLFASCHTGIEDVTHITDKQVERVEKRIEKHTRTASLTPYADSVANWRIGEKRFYVTDDNVRLLIARNERCNPDSLRLRGSVMTYAGTRESSSTLDNRDVVSLLFTADDGTVCEFPTNKVISDFSSTYTIPFFVDLDLVEHVAQQIKGKSFFIKTRLWYNANNEQMIDGRQFVQVRIDSVQPGNKVYPLRLVFTALDNSQRAMVWLSEGSTAIMTNRDFDDQFVLTDPHLAYPNITDVNWLSIINGRVAMDMTKEECRLAKGAPRSINQLPLQTGLREVWNYDGGSYLYFEDGILKDFRQ